MINKVKKLLSIFILLLSSGCAFAPFSHLSTARTVGKGVYNFSGGVIGSASGGISGGSPVLKVDYGVFDNLDVGIHYEMINTGMVLKYAIYNKKEDGMSLAMTGGGGSIGNGGYWNVGPIASYKIGFFEPYAAIKLTRVTKEHTNFSIIGFGTFQAPSNTFDFFYFTIGMMAWASDRVGILLEYNFFGTNNTSTTFPTPGYLAGAISYKL